MSDERKAIVLLLAGITIGFACVSTGCGFCSHGDIAFMAFLVAFFFGFATFVVVVSVAAPINPTGTPVYKGVYDECVRYKALAEEYEQKLDQVCGTVGIESEEN